MENPKFPKWALANWGFLMDCGWVSSDGLRVAIITSKDLDCVLGFASQNKLRFCSVINRKIHIECVSWDFYKKGCEVWERHSFFKGDDTNR